MTSPDIDDSEFRALRELSAEVGADPLRTQGAGGAPGSRTMSRVATPGDMGQELRAC